MSVRSFVPIFRRGYSLRSRLGSVRSIESHVVRTLRRGCPSFRGCQYSSARKTLRSNHRLYLSTTTTNDADLNLDRDLHSEKHALVSRASSADDISTDAGNNAEDRNTTEIEGVTPERMNAARKLLDKILNPMNTSPAQRRRQIQMNVNVEKLVVDLHTGKVDRNLRNYNRLLLAQAARGHSDAALRSFERMKAHRIIPNELTFLALLQACREGGNPDLARSIIDGIAQVAEVSDAMWAVLGQTYVRSGRLSDALELHEARCEDAQRVADASLDIDDISGAAFPLWNETLTTAVLSGCVRNGSGPMMRRAWTIFDTFRCGHGVPSAYMLTTMIHACGITGEAEKALSLFEEFQIDGIDGGPPQAAFVGVMRACARSRHWNQETFTYFDRMLAHNYAPNVESMNVLIDACALTGDVERAKKLFAAIEAHPEIAPDIATYTSMLNVYARGQRPRKPTKDRWAVPALRNPRRGLQFGQTLRPDHDQLARLDHDEEESTGRRSLVFQKYDPFDYARRTGDWQDHPLIEQIEDAMPSEDAAEFLSLAGGFGDDEAKDEKLKPLIGSGDDCDGEYDTEKWTSELGMVAEDTIVSSEGTAGRNVVDESDALTTTASTLPSLATRKEAFGVRQTRYIEEARDLFDSMTRDAGIEPSAPSLNALLKVHTEALRLNQAEACLKRFQEHEIETDQFTFGSLVSMYARSRRVERALELKSEMETRGFSLTGHVYGQLVHACAISGNDALVLRGLELLKEMGEKSPPLRTRERFLREIRRCADQLNEAGVVGFDDAAISVVPPHYNEIYTAPETKAAARKRAKKHRRRINRLVGGASQYKRTTY